MILSTGHGDLPLAIEALTLGAADFIEEPYDAGVLFDAIRTGIKSTDHEQLRNMEIRERIATLSEPERRVLDAVVAGHTSEIVAEQLGISKRGVEIHLVNIMTKLQAESFSQLVRMVLVAGA